MTEKSLRSDYKTISTTSLATESTIIYNTKYTIYNLQLNTVAGLNLITRKKNA
jgi:hypothetical protein